MAWTAPRTWVVGELITKTLLDTHLRDNLLALKEPPSDQVIRDNLGDYSYNGTSLADIDSTNLKCTITTNGGDVMVWFVGTFSSTGGTHMVLDILVDGTTRVGAGFGGLVGMNMSTSRITVTIPPVIVSGLAAGEHNFVLQWKTGGTTCKLHANSTSGTISENVPAILVAREVS